LLIGLDGKIQGSDTAVYTSPKAIDSNDDPINMIFDLKGTGYFSASKNEDNTFSLTVNKNLILPPKSESVTITLSL
jgi:hypothetical protein